MGGAVKLTSFKLLLALLLVQEGLGQNITFTFFDPNVVSVPIVGTLDVNNFGGNPGCIQITSPFFGQDDDETSEDMKITLDCIRLYESDQCSGRTQILEDGGSSIRDKSLVRRRSGIDFNPNSFMRCSGFGSDNGVTLANAISRHTKTPRRRIPTQEPPRRQTEETALVEHNELRRLHGVPKLRLNDDLNDSAQEYADFLARMNVFRHSGNPTVGENLAYTPARDEEDAVIRAIKLWYDEERQYDYNMPGLTPETGHFSQLIWRSNREMGIGVAWNAARRVYMIAAHYLPGGNGPDRPGYFRRNVPKPRRIR